MRDAVLVIWQMTRIAFPHLIYFVTNFILFSSSVNGAGILNNDYFVTAIGLSLTVSNVLTIVGEGIFLFFYKFFVRIA